MLVDKLSLLGDDRFKMLEPYFVHLTMKDLHKLDVSMFNIEHRGLGQIALNSLKQQLTPALPTKHKYLLKLCLQGDSSDRKVQDVEYENLGPSRRRNLSDYFRWIKVERPVVVDLRSMKLFSLQSFEQIVSNVQSTNSIELVDLSDNHFSPKVETLLLKLLQTPNIKYVNIAGNHSLASIDSMALFKKMSLKQHEKLIWIPQEWVPLGHWSDCLDAGEQRELMSVIEKAHKEFYNVYLPKMLEQTQ